MNEEEPNCWTCAYSNLPGTEEPCASCDMYFSHFESSEPTEASDPANRRCDRCAHYHNNGPGSPCRQCTKDTVHLPNFEPAESVESEDERSCFLCKYRDQSLGEYPCRKCVLNPGLPCYTFDTNKLVEMEMMKREEAKRMEAEMLKRTCDTCRHRGDSVEEEPCLSCFDEGFCNPLNYVEATETAETVGHNVGIPQHIADMWAERRKQGYRRFVDAYNARPYPCPYCGEEPEVVEETIYPGEKHCYVVCNGAKLLPHSISIHGRTREEAVARWNSFALTWVSERK